MSEQSQTHATATPEEPLRALEVVLTALTLTAVFLLSWHVLERYAPTVDGNVVIDVSANGAATCEGSPLETATMSRVLRHATANDPQERIVLRADRNAPAPVVDRIIEQARLGGTVNVHVTTNP
jgi:biopolymer transport protein ExbD